MRVHFFNWPSAVGGADTKLAHLLRLLGSHHQITLVPNQRAQLDQPDWASRIAAAGCRAALLDDLPDRLDGWAVSLCNAEFLKSGVLFEARRRGLRVAWSSEMMWHFHGECAALALGLIDAVLYVSPEQRRRLEPAYRHALGLRGAAAHAIDDPDAPSGWLPAASGRRPVRWVTTGNFVDPDAFLFRPRGGWRAEGRPFTIGRLSRPDPDKFPDNFPATYEALDLAPPARFRVMGWSDALARRWHGHRFDERWELLPTAAMPAEAFLDDLEVLVYDTGPRFSESWGRAVVEAMLCGVVPLVPADPRHHLHRLVPHGVAGFHCATPRDFQRYARLLQADNARLAAMSFAARAWAVDRLCRREAHLARWDELFHSPEAPE
jgi:hypothetical protein